MIEQKSTEVEGYISSLALISDDEKYRYLLSRVWDLEKSAVPLVFCMLNPSTANGLEDDPTIKRCVSFAKKFGYGSIEVVNLFAWRATDPNELRSVPDPIGPEADRWIAVVAAGRTVICAWGKSHHDMGFSFRAKWGMRPWQVKNLMRDNAASLRCLGKTGKLGGIQHPKHPLYLPACADMEPL